MARARTRTRVQWTDDPDECIRLAEESAAVWLRWWLPQFPILADLAEPLAELARVPVRSALRGCLGVSDRFCDSDEATIYATEIAVRETFVTAMVCRPVRALLDELVGPDATDITREDYRILHYLYHDHLTVAAIARALRVPTAQARDRVRYTDLRWQQRVRACCGTALGDRDFPLPEALR